MPTIFYIHPLIFRLSDFPGLGERMRVITAFLTLYDRQAAGENRRVRVCLFVYLILTSFNSCLFHFEVKASWKIRKWKT